MADAQVKADDGRVFVRSKDGALYKVDAGHARDLISRGEYDAATPEQIQARTAERESSTLGAAARGAVTGAVGGVLAAPKLATALGSMALGREDPLADISGRQFYQDMAAAAARAGGGDLAAEDEARAQARNQLLSDLEAHPYATGAGELGGAIVGSGGLSAGARGLAGIGARALGGGTAARVATGIGAGILEGGALGADAASEAAWVKNAPATAQQTLAAIGLGALFGGGVSLAAAGASKLPAVAKLLRGGEGAEGIEGAALGEEAAARPVVAAEEKAAPAALDAVDEGWMAKGRRYAGDIGDQKAVESIARGQKGALKRLGGGDFPTAEEMQATGSALHELGLFKPLVSEGEQFQIAAQQSKQQGARMGAVTDQLDKEAGYADASGALAKLQDAAHKFETEGVLGGKPEGKAQANFIRDRITDLEEKQASGIVTHKDLHNERMYFDRIGYQGDAAQHLEDAARTARKIISDELDSEIAKFSPELKAEWKQANTYFGAARWAEETLKSRLAGNASAGTFGLKDILASGGLLAAGHPLAAVAAGIGSKLVRERGLSTFAAVAKKLAGEAVDVSAAPAAATNTARKLSALVAHSTETVESGVTRFLNGEKPSAVGRAVRAAPTLISRMRSGDIRDARAAYADQIREIQTVASTPEVALDRMQKLTGNVVPTYAPGLHAEMVATAERCANYLSAHAPAPAQDPNTITPQVKTSPPVSAADMTKFADRCEGAMDPLSFLRDLNSVTGVSPEKQDAVKQCHPALFEQIQQSIFTHCAARTTPLSYKQSVRLDLALDAGGTISPSLNPKNLATMQLAAAGVAKAMTKPSGGAAPKVSGMLATRSQQISGGFR